MQDLYKGFKKTAEDDASATLEHENGHALTIAKSGLSKKQKAALAKLPLHQAKGTQIPQEKQVMPNAGDQAKAVGANIADAVANKILEGATEVSTPAQQPQITPEQIEAMPTPNATEVATGQPVNKRVPEFVEGEGLTPEQVLEIRRSGGDVRDVERLATERTMKEKPAYFAPEIPVNEQGQLKLDQVGLGDRGLAETPAAPQAPAIAQAAPAAQPVAPAVQQIPLGSLKDQDLADIIANPNIPPSEQYKAALESYMRKQKLRQKVDQEFYDKLQSQEIKAPDILKDKSTLGKIGSVIAMAFSGIGAGITGKENMVMQILNDQINREIDAQKRSMDKDLTAHKFHSEQLGSAAAADLQVANDLLNIAKLQAEEQEKGWGNNEIKRLRALDFKTALQAKIAENQAKISQSQVADDVRNRITQQQMTLRPGQLLKEKPATVLQYLKGDEKVKEEAQKEIKRREAIVQNAPDAVEALDELIKEWSGVTGRLKAATYEKEPPSLKRFRLAIRDLVPEQAGVDAQAKDATVKSILADLEPSPNDVFQGQGPQIKENLNRWLRKNLSTPAMDRLRLDPENFESTALKNAEWLQTEQAKASGLKPNQIVVEMPNGKTFRIPKDQLSAMQKKYPKVKVKVQ